MMKSNNKTKSPSRQGKTPVSYYGGKQRIAHVICRMIPPHTVYTEPYCGGLAVLFAKGRPEVTNVQNYREAVNDINGDLVNFWKQLRDNGEELYRRINLTPYSQEDYRAAHTKNLPAVTDDIERARLWFVNVSQSFAKKINAGWGTSVVGQNFAKTFENRKTLVRTAIERMRGIYIGNEPALRFIDRWDSPQTFHFVDPPYPDTDQGHYKGFTRQDFEELVAKLDRCKGAFILTCYRCDWMEFPKDWQFSTYDTIMTAAKQHGATSSQRQEFIIYRPRREEPRADILKIMSKLPVKNHADLQLKF